MDPATTVSTTTPNVKELFEERKFFAIIPLQLGHHRAVPLVWNIKEKQMKM